MGRRGWQLSVEMRKEIARQYMGGQDPPEIAENLEISAITVRKWVRRFMEGGVEALASKPRTGGGGGNHLPAAVEAEIVRLGEEHPDWSERRIARVVTPMRYPDLRRGVAYETVRSILERAGLQRPPRD